jgi:hypothetical protein
MVAPADVTYVMSAEEIGWGLALITITLVLHGIGTTWAILATDGSDHPERQEGSGWDLVRIIALALLLVMLHLSEVVVWAGFFSWQDCFPTLGQSYFVALLDYTTLGCDFDLPPHWRLLEGMIAICGLLTFAWTTSVLMGVIQAIQNRRVARGLAARARAGGRAH